METQRGAESAGAEVEYIDLYDLNYNGCRSCLACKRKGIAEPCKCYWKDDLTPVLEKIWQADRLITGSPIYYSEPTGGMRSLLERLTFPAMSYNDYSSVFKGRVDVDIFLTMNAPMQYYKRSMTQNFRKCWIMLLRSAQGHCEADIEFYDCYNLRNLKIPEGVESLGENVFGM